MDATMPPARTACDTQEWIQRLDVIVPPALVPTPAEGRLAWAMAEAARHSQSVPAAPVAHSIAGRLIADTTPAWAQGLALVDALAGPLQTLEARALRDGFESGRPLLLLPFGSPERYVSFLPILRYRGANSYQAGHGRRAHRYAAPHHVAALRVAREWYFRTRLREIDGARAQATRRAKNVPRPWLDVLETALGDEGLLVTADGQLAVHQTGPHGMFTVHGADFAYQLETSPAVAVKLGLVAAASSHTYLKREWPVERMARWVGPNGWRVGKGGRRWEGGYLAGDLIYVGKQAIAHVRIHKGWLSLRFRGDLRRKPLRVSVAGLPMEVALAWAARHSAQAWDRAARLQARKG